MTIYPMQALCGAHCRTTGQPCRNHQMANGRCRMHGGKSTGRPITTGRNTAEAKRQQRAIARLMREARNWEKDWLKTGRSF